MLKTSPKPTSKVWLWVSIGALVLILIGIAVSSWQSKELEPVDDLIESRKDEVISDALSRMRLENTKANLEALEVNRKGLALLQDVIAALPESEVDTHADTMCQKR